MEVIFLGSGGAVPTVKRNHPAVLLRYKSDNILFDCGEATQIQFRKAKISPCKLTKIFITHWHGDHVLGLPGLLQTLVMNDYSGNLEIYGPKGTKIFFKRIMELFVGIGKLDVKVNEISKGKVLDNDDYEIFAEEMDHGTNCLAYRFQEKDKLRIDKKKLEKLKIPDKSKIKNLSQGKDITVNGKKIKSKEITYLQKGKVFSIVLDTKMNNHVLKVAKDADLFVCEATFLNEKEMAEEYMHLTVEQAAEYGKKANVKKLYLMHLSQRHEMNEKEYLVLARKIFKNTELAKDLMKVEI